MFLKVCPNGNAQLPFAFSNPLTCKQCGSEVEVELEVFPGARLVFLIMLFTMLFTDIQRDKGVGCCQIN
jgi:hypothetical protein